MIPKIIEERESIINRYLYNLECCDFDKIEALYESDATISNNLLADSVNPSEYKKFWKLWLSKDQKIYIRLINNDSANNTIRLLLICYSNRFKRIIYLDIITKIKQLNGKIIEQTDKIQLSTFFAHYLSPVQFLLCLIPRYSRSIKMNILQLIKET